LSGGFWPGKYAQRREKRSPATKTLSGAFWPGRYAQRREKRSPARSWPGTYAKSRKARSPATKTLSGAFWPGRYAQRAKREVEINGSVATVDDEEFNVDPSADSIVDGRTWKAWKDLMVWPYPGFLEELSKDVAKYVFCKLQY